MMNMRFGKSGEKRAAQFLKRNGFHVVELNYRSRYGEIDIIAKKNGITHFIEVKTRSSRRYGLGYEAVTKPKQIKLVKTAECYMAERGECPGQFDVISIDGDNITHIENAF